MKTAIDRIDFDVRTATHDDPVVAAQIAVILCL
jgi:hypothetical protein